MTSPLRIAAVGLGWVTLHRHLPALARNPDLQLAGVIDRQPGRAAAVAREQRLANFAETDDLSAVPWLADVDAITVGAAPMAHAPLVTAALRLGKHVLTEKPFAMTVAEGETMVAEAARQQRILAVMHNFQFSRAALKLKQDLTRGRLGTLRRLHAVQLGNPARRLPSWYQQLPLGLFYDESPHFYYLLRWLAGGELHLQHVTGIAAPDGGATPAQVNLFYRGADRLPVTLACQFDSAVSEWHLLVTGDKGVGIVDIFRDIYLRLPNDGTHALPAILRTSAAAIAQHLWQHLPNGLSFLRGRLDYGNDEVFRRFAHAIRSGTAPSGIGAEDALAVLRLQHEATAALQGQLLV